MTGAAASTTNLTADTIQESYADDTISLMVKNNAEEKSTKHNFTCEACISPVFANTIIPVLIQSSNSTDSNATITLSVKSEDNSWSDDKLKLELTKTTASGLKHSSDVIFVRLPEIIYSAAKADTIVAENNLKIEINNVAESESVTVALYAPSKFIDYSAAINDKDIGNDVLNRIKALTKIGNPDLPAFDFTYRVDESIAIPDPTDPESFFDSNHIKNKFVIS